MYHKKTELKMSMRLIFCERSSAPNTLRFVAKSASSGSSASSSSDMPKLLSVSSFSSTNLFSRTLKSITTVAASIKQAISDMISQLLPTMYLTPSRVSYSSKNCIKSSVMTPPTVPMILMTVLPCERICFGVTSGMSATAGVRYRHINTSMNAAAVNINHSNRSLCAKLTSSSVMAANVEPHTMNGIRRPNFDRSFIGNRSDISPMNGNSTSAKMLSSAMTKPISVCDRSKSFKNSGIRLSYTCQNIVMVKNASPTKTVRPILSLSFSVIVMTMTSLSQNAFESTVARQTGNRRQVADGIVHPPRT